MTEPRRTLIQSGRAKAYRPLPIEERRARLAEGLAAYGRDDFFLAHELLEPAWMGTDDLPERELIQGLIKLAAAYVHASRGNPKGVEKNLRGALARIQAGMSAGPLLGIEVAALIAAIDARLRAGPMDPPPAIERLDTR